MEVDGNEEEEEGKENGGVEFEVWGNDEGVKSTSSPDGWRRGRREAIRRYWKEGKLICEQTNLLSSGRRRRRRRRRRCIDEGIGNYSGEPRRCEVATDDDDVSEEVLRARKEEAEEDRRYKLGRFTDALKSYADRLVSIVEDELSDVGDDGDDAANDGRYRSSQFYSSSSSSSSFASSANGVAAAASIVWADRENYGAAPTSDDNGAAPTSHPKWSMSNDGLRRFIEKEYGSENARQLMAQTLCESRRTCS